MPTRPNHRMRMWFVAFIVSAVWAVSLVTYVITRPRPPELLGDMPPQTVELTSELVDQVSIPAVHAHKGDWPDIPVTAIKCVNGTDAVSVSGQPIWQLVIPPGFQWQGPGGIANRPAGCTTFHFRNKVPQAVQDRVLELAKTGTNTTVWHIVGTDSPTLNGVEGVPRKWVTGNFAIVYSEKA